MLHIVGGVLGGLVVVRLVTYLDRAPRLAAAALVLGMAGVGGVVGYGLNTIAVGLGGVDLIDATGAATVLKPLGLAWPMTLLLLGIGLLRTGRVPPPCGLAIVVAAVAYPVARIGNISWLAVVVDVVLLVCLAVIPFVLRREGTPGTTDSRLRAPTAV